MAITPKKVKKVKATAVAKAAKPAKLKSKAVAVDDLKKKKKKSNTVAEVSTGTSLYPMLGQDEALIRDENLADYTRRALFQYGSYVVEDRAIADYRDGLKPVHRALLWSLADLGLRPGGAFKKAARTVGDCFVAGTEVDTPTGKVLIENTELGQVVENDLGQYPIEDLFENPPSEIIRVTTSTASVECTEGQLFYVLLPDGSIVEKAAKDLVPGDKVGRRKYAGTQDS